MRDVRPKVVQLDPARRARRVPSGMRRRVPNAALAAACIAIFAGTVTAGLAWPQLQLGALDASAGGTRIVRVIDGDTVVVANGEHVRILNIDTAEMPPHSRCEAEVRLALAAKARLGEMVRKGREVGLSSDGGRDRDRYGRQLRLVRIDGRDVGEALIAEGLAQRWRGHRATWC